MAVKVLETPCALLGHPDWAHSPSAGRTWLNGYGRGPVHTRAILSQREQMSELGVRWQWWGRAAPKAVGSLERLGPAIIRDVPAGARQLHLQDNIGVIPYLYLMTPEGPPLGG